METTSKAFKFLFPQISKFAQKYITDPSLQPDLGKNPSDVFLPAYIMRNIKDLAPVIAETGAYATPMMGVPAAVGGGLAGGLSSVASGIEDQNLSPQEVLRTALMSLLGAGVAAGINKFAGGNKANIAQDTNITASSRPSPASLYKIMGDLGVEDKVTMGKLLNQSTTSKAPNDLLRSFGPKIAEKVSAQIHSPAASDDVVYQTFGAFPIKEAIGKLKSMGNIGGRPWHQAALEYVQGNKDLVKKVIDQISDNDLYKPVMKKVFLGQ